MHALGGTIDTIMVDQSPELMQGISGTLNPAEWLVDVFSGGDTDSGIRVNHKNVLTDGPVHQAVTLVSGDLAGIPIDILRTDNVEKKKDKDHAAHWLLNEESNYRCGSFDVRETIQMNAMLRGNGVAAIEFLGGQPTNLWPLDPGCVSPRFVEGQLVFEVTTSSGGRDILFPHEIFHVKGIGTSVWGYNTLALMKNTIGNGLAVQKFQGRSFANGEMPSGVLTTAATTVSDEARDKIRMQWSDRHRGVDNVGKIALLTHGTSFQALTLTHEQAQMIESLKNHREEVAAFFNVPPHKLGVMDASANRANIEEQNRQYIQTTIMRWSNKWTQEVTRKLLRKFERTRSTHQVKFNFRTLLRGDTKSRHEVYATGRQWGMYSANDCLRFEDLNEIGPQGDIYMFPSNMADADSQQPLGTTPQQADNGDRDGMGIRLARRELHRIQKLEIQNLRKGVQSKRGFDLFADKFYSTFSGMMSDRLSLYFEPDALAPVVEVYAKESRAAVADAATLDQLVSVVASWPSRAEGVLLQLHSAQRKV